jgi:hypothetical protein
MRIRLGTGADAALWAITREHDGWWCAHCSEHGLRFTEPTFELVEQRAPESLRKLREAMADLAAACFS